MNPEISYDKTTDVAYVDVCVKPADGLRIEVVDVTERLGFGTPILARMDEDGNVLGLIIQDFSSFKWELRKKYMAFAIGNLLELIVSKVRDITAHSGPHHAGYTRMAAHY